MEKEEQQQQHSKEGNNHQQTEQQKEEEWQVQRRKNNKSQEERMQKTVWRPTSTQSRVTEEQPQNTTQQTGTTNTSNHNSFTNLNMQEKQNAETQEPNSDAGVSTHGAQNRSKADHNQKSQAIQTGNKVNNTSTGIDSMLPIPKNPNTSYLNGIVEVEGGMDGGCQEKHTNMQERGSKGGHLSHVLHEGTHLDHNSDLRTPATTTSQHLNSYQQQVQQHDQTEARKQINAENFIEKQQGEARTAGKQNKGSMAKDMGAKASTSTQGTTPKSKNKPCKKRRETSKKRQNIQQDIDQQGKQQMEGESCKKFIMVDEHQGMDITPLQTHYMNPPHNVPPDKMSEKCHMNKGPIFDEYAVDNSEDELDVDNQSLKDPDEDDETSEALIRAFSPHPDKSLANEVQQVINNQGLSPRGIHHDRFQFEAQDINTVTAGRPNTRLFTSRSSQ
ncbi:ras-interacting protein RIP3-like [Solanum tuberosum]|uniref:ras-interacting protein RIP3-like n=1 Tax=Solanum tuberosum TaxID=4113 RepID=UPI00073A4BE9|nr:PREDICTED: ras-interacting protein RIP3-like [Solanum tuberosum]